MAAPGFFARWGLAVAAPRAALTQADQPAEAGRSSGDLLRAIGVLLVAAHTRILVGAAWIGVELGPGAAVPRLLRAVSSAAMVTLVFVVLAALVITVLAGRRRSLSADFELACVAGLAPVTVALAASVAVALGAPAGLMRGPALVLALGWGGVIAGFGVARARARAGGGS